MATAADDATPASSRIRTVIMAETAATEQLMAEAGTGVASAENSEARTAPTAMKETTTVLNTLRLSTQVGTMIPNVAGYSLRTNQKETVRARIMRSVP